MSDHRIGSLQNPIIGGLMWLLIDINNKWVFACKSCGPYSLNEIEKIGIGGSN